MCLNMEVVTLIYQLTLLMNIYPCDVRQNLLTDKFISVGFVLITFSHDLSTQLDKIDNKDLVVLYILMLKCYMSYC